MLAQCFTTRKGKNAMACKESICRKKLITRGCLILLTIGFVICSFTYQIMSVYQYFHHQKWEFSMDKDGGNSNETLILYWTTFFQSKDYEVGFDKQPFIDCPKFNCKTTNNRSLLNQSDAIIFHMRNFNFDDLPSHRLTHQRWIFFLLESPQNTPSGILDRLDNFFNWTMTYRFDSDVPFPNGIKGNLLDERIMAEAKDREIREFDRRLTDLLLKKNNTIAWVVSNCYVIPSGRAKYVQVLQKYINVTMYGNCSHNPCPRENCFEMLGQQYKFYLSFENSLCRDYVTEKFYNSLFNNMVPIVYGSADYSRIPELSSAYIDTRNFTSVEALANYLHYLDKNDEAYLKYFEWRRKPTGLSVLPRKNKAWCNLCQMLSKPSTYLSSSHKNLSVWWKDQAQCGRDKKLFDDQIKRTENNTS